MATILLKDIVPEFKAKASSLTPENLPDELLSLASSPALSAIPGFSDAMAVIAAGMSALTVAKQAAQTVQQLQPVFKTASDVVGAAINPAMIPEVAMNAAAPLLGGSVDAAVQVAIKAAIDSVLNYPIEIP